MSLILLITNRKSHTGFRFRWPWITFNCVIALILLFSPNSIALQADYVIVIEDRPIMSVKYCLPVPVFHFRPAKINSPCSAVSAIAERLVIIIIITLGCLSAASFVSKRKNQKTQKSPSCHDTEVRCGQRRDGFHSWSGPHINLTSSGAMRHVSMKWLQWQPASRPIRIAWRQVARWLAARIEAICP